MNAATLHRYALRDEDGLRAEILMHAAIATAPVACACCLVERAVDAWTLSPPDERHVSYGLCATCKQERDIDKVGRLVEANLNGGSFEIEDVDDLEDTEDGGAS